MGNEKVIQVPRKNRLRDRLLLFLAPRLGSIFIRLLGSTWKFSIANPELELDLRPKHGNLIFAFWHEWILIPCYTHRGKRIMTLVSQHRDGELIARTAQRLGFHVARGSTTRGGASGLRNLCRAADSGFDLSINPDGPRGPRRQAQPGVLYLSSLSKIPIVPVAFFASSAWRFSSWDRFAVPKPFSKVCMAFGEPLQIPREISEEMVAEYEEMLQTRLEAAEKAAEKFLQEGKSR